MEEPDKFNWRPMFSPATVWGALSLGSVQPAKLTV